MGLLTDEVRAFLQKPLVARMSTIDQQGYPHTVPVWFKLDGDDVMIIAERSTQIGHIAQSRRSASAAIRGWLATCSGRVFGREDRPAMDKRSAITTDRSKPEDIEAWSDLDMIVIRMKWSE